MIVMAPRIRAAPRHGGADYRVRKPIPETAAGASRGGGNYHHGGMRASAPFTIS
jgi:hypothetical protein